MSLMPHSLLHHIPSFSLQGKASRHDTLNAGSEEGGGEAAGSQLLAGTCRQRLTVGQLASGTLCSAWS